MSALGDEFAAQEQRMRELMAESDELQKRIEEIRADLNGNPRLPKAILSGADVVERACEAEGS